MLKFLGTGSAFNTALGSTAAYYKENGKLLLLDCGESVFAKILQQGILDDVQSAYIAITHTHSDHVGSLGSLVFYLLYAKGIVPKIITKEEQKSTLRNYLAISGVDEKEYDFICGKTMANVFEGMECVSMQEIKHSDRLTSYAIQLKFKDKNIYYLGDNNDPEYIKAIINDLKDKDIVYADAASVEYENAVHITLNKLAEIVPQEKRKQVYCMHFDGEELIQRAKAFGFNCVAVCDKG